MTRTTGWVRAFAIVGVWSVLPSLVPAQTYVRGWGQQVFDSRLNEQAFVDLEAGSFHTVARRSDGSVVVWGSNGFGLCNVPALPVGLTYVGIAAGAYHSAALRSDGSVVAWGNNATGECNVPVLPGGLVYVEVAAGANYTVARRSDGSVVA